ncbi:MAG: flagellar hook protein FlgE [Defluviitaleaceae bacterium]|nr:flagellar hook protein FlgE [Defluviitaleaceae bacterium]
MMRSMFSGVSGLRAHQTRMDVIAHNISNVNTVGFKASRTLFNDVFSQTLSSAAGANVEATGRGGQNAMQIGLGVNVASVDRLMTQGAAQRTDNAFDLMLDGSGFFIVGDATGTYFTRNGATRLDHDGNLLISNGMRLMGWEVTESTNWTNESERWQVQRTAVQGIQVRPEHWSTPPRATTQVQFAGNLVPEGRWVGGAPNATPPVPPTWQAAPVNLTMNVHDSLGNNTTIPVTMQMTEHGANDTTIWNVTLVDVQPAAQAQFRVTFDVNGRLIDVQDGHATTNEQPRPVANRVTSLPNRQFYYGPAGAPPQGGTAVVPGAVFSPITIDFGPLTQFGSVRQTVAIEDQDGLPAGQLTDLSIGQDGTVMARYTNGQIRPLWRVAIAEFQNPAGLEAFGNSLFRATANSGNFDGVGVDGIMQGGVLEMSNVDLSAEFTDMIVTQRGFQANSRTITTSDDMLQELVNLRR